MAVELTCARARQMASELLDGGLSEAQTKAVKRHVASCQSCPGLYRSMVEVHARLHGMNTTSDLRPGLLKRIRQALEAN